MIKAPYVKTPYSKNNYSKYNRAGDAEFFTVEAYKLARTNISLSIIKEGCKKIVFTSSMAGEGKTTTSCNIAAAFSKHLNTKTIIVDCDLRKPSVSKFFKIKNNPGLTNYLSGMNTLDEVIQVVPGTNLSVITAGIIPPNPSELLASKMFANFLDELAKKYDYVIIDTPPINIVSDVLPVAEKSDGVVIVAYEDRSSYVDLDKAVENLKRCEAKILGFILNGSRKREKKNRKISSYRR